MSGDRRDEVLREWAAARRRRPEADQDPELEALRTAILLEDALGVVLDDAQLDPAVLNDPAAVRALIVGLDGAG